MASSEASPLVNISQSPEPDSKKRPLIGIAHAESSAHLTHPQTTPRSKNSEDVDSTSSALPENGRRKRKKTRAFEIPGPTFVRKVNTGALGVSGRGVKLATIPNIVYAMDKRHAKAPEIEFLHRLLFNSAGTVLKRKPNIRSFSGFVFRSEKERGRVRDKLTRSHLNLLKRVAALLDVSVKEEKEPKAGGDSSAPEQKAMELAAEAFLGSDSFASEDMNMNARTPNLGVGKKDQEGVYKSPQLDDPQKPGGSPDGEGKKADASTVPSSSSGKDTPESIPKPISLNDEPDTAKTDANLVRQKKEETARIGKEETVRAILSFLEVPEIPEGRRSLAQREREKKRNKKAMEKAKAQKVLQKKAEERKKQLLVQKISRESDEDGDEDLECEAKPWIIIARERQERDLQRVHNGSADHGVVANGHA